MAMKAAPMASAPASAASTHGLPQPLSGACSTPSVSRLSAAVKLSVPGTSSPIACGLRDSRMRGAARHSATRLTAPGLSITACQPMVSASQPERIDPHDSPTPNEVPMRLNARSRAGPSNSCASAAVPAAKAAAEPSPCTARARSKATMPGASVSSALLSATTARPSRKTRLRPYASASAPAAISVAPKLSMKALVTQLSCTGVPPSASRIAGSTTAGPVKLSGMPSAARQTAASSQALLESGEDIRRAFTREKEKGNA
ncbi:hypothetical protein D9M72_370860 [compost metagenome]